jgi:hypothetical protein
VGPEGEAVIDLLASDALAAGFGSVVLVVGPATGPAIRYHVSRTWPDAVPVHFALQPAPLGTVHAVLAAGPHLGDHPFGVANADDLYGEAALRTLADHLATPGAGSALVGFRLRNAVVGDSAVTRGVCRVAADGSLTSVTERRGVRALGDGRFTTDDGEDPAELDGDTLVSMNLWAFDAAMHKVLRAAMDEATGASEEAEVLLPEVVGAQLAGRLPGGPVPFTVLAADGRCLGVTHPDDLELVRSELAHLVGAGHRPGRLWSSLGAPAAG